MPEITLDIGSVNLERSSARVLVFHCPLRGEGKEKALTAVAADKAFGVERRGWQASRPSVAKRRASGAPRVPMDMKAYGSMQTVTVHVPSGTIIKVFAQNSQTWATDGRKTSLTANRYYLVRDGAAVLDVRVKMSTSPDCLTPTASLVGPLEPLSLEEAVALGVAPPAEAFRKCYDPADANFLMTEKVLAPARTSVTFVAAAPTATADPDAPAAVAVVLPAARRRKLGTT